MRRERIIAEIAREEQRLAELRSEIEERNLRLTAPRDELASLPAEQTEISRQAPRPVVPVPTSKLEKIVLFRSLFRGREDVFPRRWENSKTAKSGYSPACANEWEYGLCDKKTRSRANRRTTCGECPNQAFVPVTDEEIAKHLKGHQVMGVYPLLQDETCWFLAADFDGKTWREDLGAFVETCKTHAIAVAIERSRSGNGAHAWFFFAAPVTAADARKLGCFLITETMARRHQLSVTSYDRLFPNQDTMPKGGFGSLIALPLQRDARQHDNSVFVDDAFHPYPDQWAFLAGVPRLDPAFVRALSNEATRRRLVIDAPVSDAPDEQLRWSLGSLARPRRVTISEQLPPEVHAVLCQRFYIEKAGLPSPLLYELKRLAAFQNPEFYKKQNMRLSTTLTPRVIDCAEELDEYIALPRGCLPHAEALLREHEVTLVIDDKREEGVPLDLKFQGSLTPLQEQAVRALLEHDTGVFVAPPGIGKTVVGIYLIAARARSTLVLVHRKPLLDQWIAQLALFLGIDSKTIGQIGAGKSSPNGRLDVAMLQSVVRKGRVSELVRGYGQVIVDECHHCPCLSFERVLTDVMARYVVGLTSTPQRRDGHHPITQMQLGPVRFRVDPKSQAVRRPFQHKFIVRDTGFKGSAVREGAGIQDVYAALAADQRRNDLIFDDVVCALDEKRSPILLTERRDHLEHFAERLRNFTSHLVVLHGGMTPKQRREILAQLAAIPDGEERLLLATGRYIGEGFDDARLDTLFLALPVSWKGTLVQYSGRLHRLHHAKTEVRIYDYVDCEVPVLLRMFEKRLRGYRAIGYVREETPVGLRVIREPVVEYDEEPPRTL